MKTIYRGIPASVALAAIAGFSLLVAPVSGCNSKPNTDGVVGQVAMELSLPDGSTISSAHYKITGSSSFTPVEGDVAVDNSNTLAFQVGALPAGTGYQLTLTAKSSANADCNAGPVPFDVMADKVSVVMVSLQCGGTSASQAGNLRVSADVKQTGGCPQLDGLSAVPLEVNVGHSISLKAHATSDSAIFAWTVDSSSAGTFASASSAATSFTCSQAGTPTLTVTATGSAGCTPSVQNVPVTCSTPAGGGSAGQGAAGATAGVGGATAGVGGAGEGGATAGVGGSTAGVGGATAGVGGSTASVGGAGEGGVGGATAGVGGSTAGVGGAGEGGVGGATAGVGGATAGVGGSTAGVGGSTAGVGGSTAGVGGSGGGDVSAACKACRETNCRNFQGTGLDFVGGCFEKINTDPALGNDTVNPNDATYLSDCKALVSCARTTKCATDVGLAPCYCGSSTVDVCNVMGPPKDGSAKCVDEIQAAVRSKVNDDVALRLTDFHFPAGWAQGLLTCDLGPCAADCKL